MKILDLDSNHKLIISPEALGLTFFKGLWSRDKSKTKEIAYKDISYVYYYSDFNSPFFDNPPDQREGLIKKHILNDDTYKVDKDVLNAIEEYKKLCRTPAMEMLEAASIAIDRMKHYFSNVDFKNGEDEIDKVQRAIINMPKMISSINDAKKACIKESTGNSKVRGDAKVSMFEDKEDS